MKVKYHPDITTMERMSLEEFADKYNLTLDIHTREDYYRQEGLYKYFVSFDRMLATTKYKDSAVSLSVSGNGNTVDGAIADYVQKLSGTLLVYRPEGKKDMEHIGPFNLYYSKPRELDPGWPQGRRMKEAAETSAFDHIVVISLTIIICLFFYLGTKERDAATSRPDMQIERCK